MKNCYINYELSLTSKDYSSNFRILNDIIAMLTYIIMIIVHTLLKYTY